MGARVDHRRSNPRVWIGTGVKETKRFKVELSERPKSKWQMAKKLNGLSFAGEYWNGIKDGGEE